MAGGVTGGEKDGLVFRLRFGEGIGAPRIPVDGVMGVLEEVGALLVGQAVGGHGKLLDAGIL